MTRASGSIGWPSSAAGLIALVLQLAAPSTAPALGASRAWAETRSTHFRVVSSDVPAARRVARSLEALRAVLAQRGHTVHEAEDGPVLVVLAEGRDYAAAAAALSLPASGSAGFAILSERGEALVLDRDTPQDDVSAVAYRGYVHLVLGRRSAAPPWFSEGLAEYYRTFLEDGGQVLLGRALEGHVRNVRYHSLLPFERVFTLDRASVEALPAQERSVYTSQAWALVHSHFSNGQEGRRQLARLMELLETGASPADALEEALDTTPEQLDRDVRRYVRQRRFTFTSAVYELDRDAAPAVTAGAASSDSVLGELTALRETQREIVTLTAGPFQPTPAEYPVSETPAL